MKKVLKVFLIAMLVCLCLVGCTSNNAVNSDTVYDKELLVNGDFEAGTKGWDIKKDDSAGFIYAGTVDVSKEDDNYVPEFGERYMNIEVVMSPGYYNMMQTVTLEKGVNYRLSAYINVVNTPEGNTGKSYVAAFLGFKDDSVISRIEERKITDGFSEYEVYFTPKKSGKHTLVIGNGVADLMVKGQVHFDNVSIKAVKEVPPIYDLFIVGAGFFDVFNQTTEGIVFVTLLSILSIAVVIAGYYAIKKSMSVSEENLGVKLFKNVKARRFFTSPYTLSIAAVVVAFIVRFIIVNTVAGFSIELNAFSNWSSSLVNKGLVQFYESYTAAPIFGGQLYILSFIGVIAKLFGIPFGSMGFFVLLKIPAIIADLIIVFIIFELVMQNKQFNKVSAFLVSLTYAVIPVVFTISSAWGQFTSVGLLFLLLAVISIVKQSKKDKKSIFNNPIVSVVFIALAIFFEPMMAVSLPILIGYFAIKGIMNQDWKLLVQVTCTLIGAFVLYFLAMLPFTINQVASGNVFFFIEKIGLACTKGGLATNDMFNFLALFGNNNVTATTASIALNYIIILVVSALSLYSYYVNRNRLELVLHIGMIFLVNSVFGLYVNIYTTIIAITLLYVYFAMTGETRVLGVTAMFSFTSFINAALLMNYSGYIGSGASSKYTPFVNGSAVVIVFSIINILIACYFFYVVFDIAYKKKRLTINPNESLIANMKEAFAKSKKN